MAHLSLIRSFHFADIAYKQSDIFLLFFINGTRPILSFDFPECIVVYWNIEDRIQ